MIFLHIPWYPDTSTECHTCHTFIRLLPWLRWGSTIEECCFHGDQLIGGSFQGSRTHQRAPWWWWLGHSPNIPSTSSSTRCLVSLQPLLCSCCSKCIELPSIWGEFGSRYQLGNLYGLLEECVFFWICLCSFLKKSSESLGSWFKLKLRYQICNDFDSVPCFWGFWSVERWISPATLKRNVSLILCRGPTIRHVPTTIVWGLGHADHGDFLCNYASVYHCQATC